MKGFNLFAVFSITWVLVVMLWSVHGAPSDRIQLRSDLTPPPPPDATNTKNGTNGESSLYDYLTPDAVSTVVGAALGEDDCRQMTLCKAGSYVKDVTGKEIVLMLLDRWVPSRWQDTLKTFKEAAVYGDDCEKQFNCTKSVE